MASAGSEMAEAGCNSASSNAVYAIFKSKFMTRSEPEVFSAATSALEVFGDEAVFVATDFPGGNEGLIAVWKFQSTGEIIGIKTEEMSVKHDFPIVGETTVCTRLFPAHVDTACRLCILRERDCAVVFYFPVIICRDMSTVSNVLCVYNPIFEPRCVHQYGARLMRTKTPRTVLLVFPSSRDAYKACCLMQRDIIALKRRRRKYYEPLQTEDDVAVSYQRPSLMCNASAKKLCDKSLSFSERPLFLMENLAVPSLDDVQAFETMWVV